MAGAKSKGLGKGLEALFGDIEINVAKDEPHEYQPGKDQILFIDINDIKPNSSQPRQIFDEEKINELASSIAMHGVIQPLLLKQAETGFELVAGERRWRAARKAGLKQVPGIVKELTGEQRMLIALIENIQREDLNPIEEAEAFQKMHVEFGFKQDDISKNIGKSRPYITNALRLLKLPEEIRGLVLSGKLSSGHARALVSIDSEKMQLLIARRIENEGLSVRETEDLVRDIEKKHEKNIFKRIEKSVDILEIEEELKTILGTKVTLKHGRKSGKLEINYYSRDELERLIEIFRGLK